MALVLGTADYAVIILMLSISAAIGIYFRFTGGRQKTTLEFIMAGKNMSVLPVTFSMLGSSFSAVAILGTATEIYLYGMQIAMKDLTWPIGMAITTYCILPVYFDMDENSIYELLYMPLVLYAPSLALSTVTGLSVWTSVTSMAIVCTFYSTLGGLKAVLWTDLFQAILMLITIYCLIIKGSVDFGGFYKVFETAQKTGRMQLFNTSVDLTVRYTLWNSCAQGLIYGIFWSGTTFLTVQRLMSSGCVEKARKSILLNIPLSFVFQVGISILGITMYAYYSACDPLQNGEVKSGDQLLILYILKVFGHIPGLPGFCVAGIFSAALSSMSSILNALAAITLEDYIKPFVKGLTESRSSLLVKILALFYGGLCLLLTFVIANAKGLLQTSIILTGIVGGPTLGVFLLGLFTKSANELGSMLGLISGFVIHACIGFGSLFYKSTYPSLPLSTVGCHSNSSIFSDIFRKGNSTLDMNLTNYTSRLLPGGIEEEGYIFPLFKMSYMWQICVSFSTTLLVGYVASNIVGFWRPAKKIDPKLLSPAVRKWLCKTTSMSEKEKNGVTLKAIN